MIARLHAWFAARPMAGDAVWAAVIFLPVWMGCTVALNRTMGSWGLLIGLGWTALYCAPLLWRRTHPDLCALALVPAHLIQLAGTDNVLPGNVTALLALYAVAAYGRPRLTRPWLLFGLVAALVGALDWTVVGAIAHGAEPLATDPLGWWMFGSASVAASWFMGMLARSRRSNIQALRDRADALERERDQSRALAATQERSRIAREMHDVLAHRISLVSMHAGVLAYRTDLSAEETRSIAQIIQENAHASLTELRSVLSTLREVPSPDAAPAAPQPTLVLLPRLLEEARGFGQRIEIDQFLDAAAVPQLTSRHSYRILQECLTNARKHAPYATVEVRLAGSPRDGVSIRVANPITVVGGAGGGAGVPGARLGLVGISERAQMLGGRCDAGERGGRFVVDVWLPWH